MQNSKPRFHSCFVTFVLFNSVDAIEVFLVFLKFLFDPSDVEFEIGVLCVFSDRLPTTMFL